MAANPQYLYMTEIAFQSLDIEVAFDELYTNLRIPLLVEEEEE